MPAVQKRTSREHIAALIGGSGIGGARQWDADYLACLGLTEDPGAYGVTVRNHPRQAWYVVDLDGTVRGDPEAVLHLAYSLPHTMPNLGKTIALARMALWAKQAQERAAIPPPAPPSAEVAGRRRLLRIHDSFIAMATLWLASIIVMVVGAQSSVLIWLAAVPFGAFAVFRLITLSERK